MEETARRHFSEDAAVVRRVVAIGLPVVDNGDLVGGESAIAGSRESHGSMLGSHCAL